MAGGSVLAARLCRRRGRDLQSSARSGWSIGTRAPTQRRRPRPSRRGEGPRRQHLVDRDSGRILMTSFSRRKFLYAAATSMAAAQERRGLKIFMLCDMEGSSGIFTREQAWYWENGVRDPVAAQARQLFTSDVMSAAAAALAAGVSELIVCDTHHGGGNLMREKLSTDPRITYLYRSVGMENDKRRWLPGLDQTVAGLMLPGHHAKAFTKEAFLPH